MVRYELFKKDMLSKLNDEQGSIVGIEANIGLNGLMKALQQEGFEEGIEYIIMEHCDKEVVKESREEIHNIEMKTTKRGRILI